MKDYNIVRNDFNEIAELNEPKWNHNNCYFNQLMKLIPDYADTCLDIGCGKGELSLMLSRKAKRVIAVDIAEKMIEKAKALHSGKIYLEIFISLAKMSETYINGGTTAGSFTGRVRSGSNFSAR